MTDRYEGKPFLRLVDAYVLDLIGALDPATAQGMVALEPRLRGTFSAPEAASWQEIVRGQLQLDDPQVHSIREAWSRQLLEDDGFGKPHDPVAWAYAVSDQMTS